MVFLLLLLLLLLLSAVGTRISTFMAWEDTVRHAASYSYGCAQLSIYYKCSIVTATYNCATYTMIAAPSAVASELHASQAAKHVI